MKRLLLLAGVMLCPAMLVAGVFASGIHFTNPDSTAFDGSVTDGTGLRINYVLSDTATAVEIKIQNASTNAVIHTINLVNQIEGWQNIIWSGTGAPAGTATYYVTITATRNARSSTQYKLGRFILTGTTGFNIFARGVDIVRNQASRDFGFAYAANAGGPIGRGIARYTATGYPAGTRYPNPFLTQSDTNNVGNGWSADVSSPNHSTVDDLGRIYASDFLRGEVWRLDNNAARPKVVVRVTEPKGLAITGSGANRKIYIASAGNVVRANIGDSDTLTTPLEMIAVLGGTVRDVIFDDEGKMFVNRRSGTGFDGTAGGKTYRFNITGSLPVGEFDALMVSDWTGFPIGLGHWGGTNRTSADDDIIYVSHRAGGTTDLPGVHRFHDLNGFSPIREHFFRPSDVPGGGGGDISTRADITVDPTGNIVFFENGNEEIIYIEPPSTTPVSYATRSAVTFSLGSTSVEELGGIPGRFALKQNYPNPFNPATTIEFSLPSSGRMSLRVYDMLGREVATLLDEERGAGNYRATFDARSLPSGTYLYVLRSGGYSQAKRMLLVK